MRCICLPFFTIVKRNLKRKGGNSKSPHIFLKMSSSARFIPQPPPLASTVAAAVQGGRPDGTVQWSDKVTTMVQSINAEVAKASQLRGSAVKDAQCLSKHEKEMADSAEAGLRRRLKETKSVKSKLSQALRELAAEVAALEDVKAKAAALMEKFGRPLNKCNARVSLRAQRPPAERIEDPPARAIAAHELHLRQSIELLHDRISAVDNMTAEGQRQLHILAADVAAKQRAIEVDTQCLSFGGSDGASAGALQQDTNNGSDDHDSRIPSVLPASVQNAFRYGKSTKEPNLWKQVSAIAIENARSIANAACELRAKLFSEMKRMTQVHKAATSTVADTLHKKVRQTQSQLHIIQDEIAKVEGEMAILLRQREAVIKALEAKQQPIATVAKRLEVRRARPTSEMVRDEVELSLEKELAVLLASVADLTKRKSSIEDAIQRMANAQLMLQREFDAKAAALGLERKCADFDTMSEFSISSSRGGSARIRDVSEEKNKKTNGGGGGGDFFLPRIQTPRGKASPRH